MITIEQLSSVVVEAAKLMTTEHFDITQKGGYADIVTSSDLAVQAFLCERLSVLLPGSGFLCEEVGMRDINHEYLWIIDPIDGTANYSRGIDQCAICVALRHHADIVMGVVYVPRTGEMFTAQKGHGAFRNGKPIHVSDRPFANAVVCTAFSVYHKEYTDICADIIVSLFRQCNDFRRFGACAPELCYLAMGRCELYFEYMLGPWDFAAASLVVTEAGGIISDLHGQPLSCLEHKGVIAANSAENFQKLLETVQGRMSLTSSPIFKGRGE